MTFRNTLLAVAAVFATANSHMIMKSPVPYSADSIDNGPISASQFPCKSNLGFEVKEQNKMAVGEKSQLSFTGSAVHNGGTCQLSVALGQQPDGSTPFKVIKTIEGGCPGTAESGPKVFDFELPPNIPNGEHTFAWTWMPTSSGGPEFYMNCAPIEVSGGAEDESKFNELPDMLVANLPGLSDCTQTANTILKVPNPGDVVEHADDSGRKIAPPTGNCGGSAPGGDEKRSSSTAQGQQPTAAPSSSPAAPPSSSSATPSSAPAIPSNPGGIFAPGASSAAGLPTTTTLVTVTAAPSSAGPTPSVAPSVAPSAAPSSAPSAVTPSAVVPGPTAPINTAPAQPTEQPTNGEQPGGTCTENGSVVCNGEDQFGLCNFGTVVWQPVAAGTKCSNGSIQRRAYNGRIVRRRY